MVNRKVAFELDSGIMKSKTTKSGWKEAFTQFSKTTTLHGFKYLSSRYYVDRVGWLACCCASTGCAALLFTALWARFLEVPALLVLCDIQPYETVVEHTPDLTVCPPVETVARAFVAHLSNNTNGTSRLPRTIARVLRGKKPPYDQLKLLDELLKSNNITLRQAMYQHTPSCEQLVVKCRWQDIMIPCNLLFIKEITSRGVCCVMHSDKAYSRLMHTNSQPNSQLALTRNVELAMQGSNDSNFGFQFVTKLAGEDEEESMALYPGFNYVAQLHFTSVPQSSVDNFIQTNCNSDKGYSRVFCMAKCTEKIFGCSDPLRVRTEGDENFLPPCSVTQLGYKKMNVSCECPPSCKKVTTMTSLEYSAMDSLKHAIDPIYKGLNASTSTVIFLRVIIKHSRIFTLIPTETWFTLLSSLGGVFNMFLGFGLFSAIEILFLLFFKLPFAIKTTAEITVISSKTK